MIETTRSLSFSEAMNAATSKIFQFQGRSRRSEFWWTQLVVYIASVVLTPFIGFLLDLLTIPLTFRRLHDTGRSGWWWGIGALLKLTFILFFGYDIAMSIINANNLAGYESQLVTTLLIKYSLFTIIISIYQVMLLVFYCLDSEPFENQYGASPKYVDEEENES